MAKLGTNKRPVRFRVQTEERLQEIALLYGKIETKNLRTWSYLKESNFCFTKNDKQESHRYF